MHRRALTIDLPEFATAAEQATPPLHSPADRMRLVVELSARNVSTGSGGPFAAALFAAESGRLVAVGVNSVVRLNNPVLHAETVALMRAASFTARYSLSPDLDEGGDRAGDGDTLVLYSSCEPCAMCLGAILWSGVKDVVFAARRDDAQRLGFDEGPVFPETFAYLRRRGVRVAAGPMRSEAVHVLELYRATGGPIYNG